MNISYKWLKRYIDFDLSPKDLAAVLTSVGLECDTVEEVESIRGGLRGVVIGKVLTCEPHPDSDHLHVTTVDLGGDKPEQIVCGAPNVAAGQTVVVATVGTILYDGDKEIKIKKSKIRGVESMGMICAEDELGLGASHEGIIVIPEEVRPGTPAAEYFNVESDWCLEVELTPNRVDAASHYGVARDLKAKQWCDIALGDDRRELPEITTPDVSAFAPDRTDGAATITVDDRQGCPRYSGVTIRGVKVAESPEWLKALLVSAGQRPINNIVDITNYILHAFCQPLHCFDADRIGGGRIVVRTCPEGTVFTTLDGVERKLNAADLMICDAERPMCMAGVFGGLDSGVTDETHDIFLESACFNPTSVRRTARRHGLSTDSSFRFERGVDPNMQVYAAKRAALLMKELAGGTISSDITDLYPAPIADFVFDVKLARVNALIGKEIPEQTVRTILAALEVKVLAEKEGVLTVAVPPYRVDVQREADLIEEILRIYGYNNVEIPSRVRSTLSYAPQPDRNKLMNLAADFLTANGFTEIMSNSLIRGAYYEGLASCPAERCVRIINPLSADLNVMRQTLLFNMLEAVALNANRKNGDLKLYEFGNCYFYDADKRSDENPLAAYSEEYRLAIAVSGVAVPQSWNVKPEKASFFTLRAVAEKLLRRFGVDIYALRCESVASDLFGEALALSLGNKELLRIGTVAGRIRRMLDVKQEVYYLEMNFDALVKSTRKHRIAAEELSKFPEVKRDLALLVDKQTTFSALRDVAFATERKLLKSVALFDVYEGDKLPEGKKSYALSFVLEDRTRTLDEKTIERVMANLTAQFESRCGATVRS